MLGEQAPPSGPAFRNSIPLASQALCGRLCARRQRPDTEEPSRRAERGHQCTMTRVFKRRIYLMDFSWGRPNVLEPDCGDGGLALNVLKHARWYA